MSKMAASITPANYYYRKSSGPLTKKYYEDAMYNMSSFNLKISNERKMRLPFLDSQTRIAQNHCHLWASPHEREPGAVLGQIYTYPQRKWKKRKRETPSQQDLITKAHEGKITDEDLQRISTAENPAIVGIRCNIEKQQSQTVDSPSRENSRDKWYVEDYDELDEPPDAGEIDDPNSDSSDFEDQFVKRKRKKNKQTKSYGGRPKSKRTARSTMEGDFEDREKPYKCESCGARYKTRAGLHYHMNHYHAPHHPRNASPPQSTSQDTTETVSGRSTRNSAQPATFSQPAPPPATTQASRSEVDEKAEANDYCDFCLGDKNKNTHTGIREDLVSCSDCGRSGHPSCLQFTANMITSVKKYAWQCIECKSCGLCGTSDNDDQLLFCDDCDRGYHMYCLKPPLSEPPEGSWSCHLCINEFHGGKKDTK